MVKNNPARKTTLEERLSSVEYCIEHDDNYSLTAGQYNCSCAQVRSWVLKYRAEGIEGLCDRRGRKKTEGELTELERLQAENRMLKAKASKQQMEIVLLKNSGKQRGGDAKSHTESSRIHSHSGSPAGTPGLSNPYSL